MTIATILGNKGSDVVSIAGEATVAQAVTLLAERRIGAVPVMRGDAVAGIFSERDVIYCLEREGASALARPVSAVMTVSGPAEINATCCQVVPPSVDTSARGTVPAAVVC